MQGPIQGRAAGPRGWCFFQSEAGPRAIDAAAVVGVIEVPRFVEVPLGPPCLRGLLVHRREVVPVLGLGPRPEPCGERRRAAPERALVLQSGRDVFGLSIERVIALEVGTNPERCPAATPDGDDLEQNGRRYRVLDARTLWGSCRGEVETSFRRATPREGVRGGEE